MMRVDSQLERASDFIRHSLLMAFFLLVFSNCIVHAQETTRLERPLAMVAQGGELRKSRDFQAAIRLLQKVVDKEPTLAPAHGELGLCYWRLGRLDEAQESLERAIELDQRLLNPYLNLAEVLTEKYDTIGASQVLLVANEVHPGRAEPYFLMAKIHLENGHMPAAEQAAQLALERDYSDVPEIHLLMAELHHERGELRREKLELELYLQKAPDGEEAVTARASLDNVSKELVGLENGPLQQYSEWLHQYRSGRYLASATALSASDLDIILDASQLYRKMPLREAQVKSAALLHTEAAIVLGQAGSTHLNMALDYLAQVRDVLFRRRWLLSMGYYFHGKSRFQEAIPFFRDASRLFPDDLEIRLALGTASEMAALTSGHPERLTQAEESYRWVLEVDPSHVEGTLRLGHVLKLMGQVEEATRCLLWIKAHTERTEYLLVADLVLGDLSRVKGDVEEAIRFYRAASEIDPGCQAAATALGLALHRSGDPEGSREIVKQLSIEKRQPPHRVDGWWRYLLGQSHNHALLVAEMRQDVHW